MNCTSASFLKIRLYMMQNVKADPRGRAATLACGLSLAGIVGSNTTGDMDVCLLCLLRVVRWTSLLLAEH